MKLNLSESSNDELLEIIKNKDLYPQETVSMAITFITERKNNPQENVEEKYVVFSKNKRYKWVLIVQAFFIVAYSLKILNTMYSFFDIAILSTALIFLLITIPEYNRKYIQVGPEIIITKLLTRKVFSWHEIKEIYMYKEEYLGLIFKNGKAYKIALEGINSEEIEKLTHELRKKWNSEVIQLDSLLKH